MVLPRSLKVARWDITFRKPRFFSRLRPAQLFIGSFLLLIALGTMGLRFLPGLYEKERLNWQDALFTATSAVCVTGLIVVDTATYFTWAGQAFLLLLIQLGGLGMITFTSLIITALGRRMSLQHEELSTGTIQAAPHFDRRRLLFDVVRFTLTFEFAGAVLLYLIWIPRLGFLGALWPAVFHSVSAFCNAGFSTFSNSLVDMHNSPLSLLVIMILIISGGLGFVTMEELYLHWRKRPTGKPLRISLHCRLVLVTTVSLIVAAWIVFALLEWNLTLREMGWFNRLVNALFLSVTPRTAGFNTIDYSQVRESTALLTIILMVIGGSPGSTAGGIKTTTFALLGVVAWSRLRGQRITTIWNRSVRDETVDRTIGLIVVAFGVILLGLFLFTLTEYQPASESKFLDRAFETISAFNTVGLSMGITETLTSLGRWTGIVLMFLGRVGPLTFASALAVRYARAGRFRYAYEDIIVG